MPGRSASPPRPTPHLEQIDASARWPVLFFFVKGSGWLVLGGLLLLLCSVKLHSPGFLANSAWLGLGRLKPAALNALMYGFACQFAFGMAIWLLCRLGRTPLLNAPLVFLGAAVWNIGVFLGILGILAGATTGFAYLEMPRVAWPFVFVGLGVIVLWALLTFHDRREPQLYVSQWFLVAALFWFPWILSASVYLLVFQPVRGVVQAVVNAWYAHNLLHLWLTPVGLAALYYFIPKLLGRPLYSRQIALFGFWTLAFFGAWGGLVRLSGGPLPSWMISASIAAHVLTIVPLTCAVANLGLTLQGQFRPAKNNLLLQFLLCATAIYALAGLLGIVTSFRTVSQITLFTYIPMLLDQMILLGFFGMAGMGAAYFILPKLTGCDWPAPRLVRWHLNASTAGLALYAVPLLVAGWIQGTRLNDPETDFMQALRPTLPWVGISTLGLLVFLAGQTLFWLNLLRLAWRWAAPLSASAWALCRGASVESSQHEAKS